MPLAGRSSASRSGHDAPRPQGSRTPRRGMRFLALRPRGWGACPRHQRTLDAGHREHPGRSPGPLSTGFSRQHLRRALDAARRGGQDGIVLRRHRGVECRRRGFVPVRAGDIRRLRQADAARWCGAGDPLRPYRRRLCRGALSVFAWGWRTTPHWPWWPTTAATPGRRVRPPRPPTRKRCSPPRPASPRPVWEYRAASKLLPSPMRSHRSARPTSTAARVRRAGSTARDWCVWAYGLAGVVVPRVANDQWHDEPHVGLNELVPGDLVFFGSGAGSSESYAEHVGIYVGNSAMVDAPHTGADVRIDTIPLVVGADWGGGEVVLGAADPVAT